MINFWLLLKETSGVFQNLHTPVVVHREKNVQSTHFRLGGTMVRSLCCVLVDQTQRQGRRAGVVDQASTVKVDRVGTLNDIRGAPRAVDRACSCFIAVLVRNLDKASLERIVIVLIQCLHRLPELLNVLLTLCNHKLRQMTELVLTHCVPASNTLVTTNCTSIAVSTRSNIVLQDEILTNHSGSIPDKLIHIQRWRYNALWKARVRALSVSFL